MLTIKELTVKNFMSVGNQAQAINFEGKNLVLVLGENVDLGGDDAGARNGTGKTAKNYRRTRFQSLGEGNPAHCFRQYLCEGAGNRNR